MNKYLYIFIICNKLNAVQERCRCILFYVSYHQLTPKRPCGPNGFEKLMCFKQSTLAKVCVVLQTSPVTMTWRPFLDVGRSQPCIRHRSEWGRYLKTSPQRLEEAMNGQVDLPNGLGDFGSGLVLMIHYACWSYVYTIIHSQNLRIWSTGRPGPKRKTHFPTAMFQVLC